MDDLNAAKKGSSAAFRTYATTYGLIKTQTDEQISEEIYILSSAGNYTYCQLEHFHESFNNMHNARLSFSLICDIFAPAETKFKLKSRTMRCLNWNIHHFQNTVSKNNAAAVLYFRDYDWQYHSFILFLFYTIITNRIQVLVIVKTNIAGFIHF